ncbi:alpha/beta hydrolase [Pedobacter sp. HMWF019]|uniref:alpha/beta hydrolase n=1 Tax=Pedobacter sp. HMWF019 TaxID=2056856 RepID=UPI000D342716|nr:alpha/beta hydrolase [Pedobacter sp. HMWF019]PTS98163.1 alpha/beta hydrolase [Pedobacter sp. HMWF019]
MCVFLSKQVKDALDYIQAIDVQEIENELEASRAFYEKFIPMAGEEEAVFQVNDLEILSFDQKINIRIYRPSKDMELPAVIYFHGGWFNAGSLETHDRPLRKLSNLSGAIVIAVDYRLAPEHPFPGGVNDGYGALNWVMNNAESLGIDLKRLAIAGDSAGGALAAVITRKAIQDHLQGILCQVLVYPVTDASLKTASWKEFEGGPVLDYEGAVNAWDLYLSNNEDKKNPDASPLCANHLAGIPKSLIIIAECDPLRDEAVLYAEKLQNEGVEVKQSMYHGMVHGFFQMGGIIDEGNYAIEEAAQFLFQNFNRKLG